LDEETYLLNGNVDETRRTYSSVWGESSYKAITHGFALSRLDSPQFWAPAGPSLGSWIQIAFRREVLIDGVIVQGGVDKELPSLPPPTNYYWDFRDCDSSHGVFSADGLLKATLVNGAVCSSAGIVLDGVDDFIDIDDWEWGGKMTFEVFAKWSNLERNFSLFDFHNGDGKEGVSLSRSSMSSNFLFYLNDNFGSVSVAAEAEDQIIEGEWVHIVVTINGPTLRLYKNGIMVHFTDSGYEPSVLVRSHHWVGRSFSASSGYFEGTVEYIRLWRNTDLLPEEIKRLYEMQSGYGDPSKSPGWV